MSKSQAIFSIIFPPQTFSIHCSKAASSSSIRWYLKSLAPGTNWTQSLPILLVWTSRVFLVIQGWWRSQRPHLRQLCLKNEQWEVKARESIIYSVNLEWTWRCLTRKQIWHRKDLGSMGQLKVVLTYVRRQRRPQDRKYFSSVESPRNGTTEKNVQTKSTATQACFTKKRFFNKPESSQCFVL